MSLLLSAIPFPYRILALALAAAALVAFGWFKGNAHGTQKLIEYKADELKQSVRIAGVRTQIVTQTQTKYVDRIQTIYKQAEAIKETVYVTKADDAGCVVTVGVVREFNAAWGGAAGPAAESDRQPSGVPLSEVAAADAFNATSCRVYKEQRDGLIEFYRKQQKVR